MMVMGKVEGEAPFSWPWPDDDVVHATMRAVSLFAPPCGEYDRVRSAINEWLSSLTARTPFGPKVTDLRVHLDHMDDEDLLTEVLTHYIGGTSYVASRAAGKMSAGFWVRLVPDVERTPRPRPVAAVDLAAVATARKLAVTGQARAIREASRITLTEMAGRLGATAGTVSRWERGDSTPGAAVAEKWLAVLDTLGRAVDIGDAAA